MLTWPIVGASIGGRRPRSRITGGRGSLWAARGCGSFGVRGSSPAAGLLSSLHGAVPAAEQVRPEAVVQRLHATFANLIDCNCKNPRKKGHCQALITRVPENFLPPLPAPEKRRWGDPAALHGTDSDHMTASWERLHEAWERTPELKESRRQIKVLQTSLGHFEIQDPQQSACWKHYRISQCWAAAYQQLEQSDSGSC